MKRLKTGTERPDYRALFAYTWDVADWSDDAFVEEMHRLGMNTLTLAAAYHAGKFTRPKGKGSKIFFPQDGHVHFRARRGSYGRIAPDTGDLARENDIFERFSARGDIALNAWTVLLHNSHLGMKFPDCTVENAFGDRYPYALCPSHPDVREYAVNLCREIAEDPGVSGLSLETPGFLPFRHGYHHEFALLGSMPGTENYLGLCFCAKCAKNAQSADVDFDGLKDRVQSRIRLALEADYEPDPDANRARFEGDLVTDPDLSNFLKMRCDVVTALVEEVRAAVRGDAAVYIIPSVNQPLGLSYLEGSDLAALSKAADGLEVCFYRPPRQTALTEYDEIRLRCGPEASIRAVLRPAAPDYLEEGGFAATVAALADAGVDGFGFYNYGHVRRSGLEWAGRAMNAYKNGELT
ncbi:MAG: hypothetical protein CML23_12040 [Rhizobiaceae bacterium]|nr:hypothetical protein [Rhizobiaceae bacterium]